MLLATGAGSVLLIKNLSPVIIIAPEPDYCGTENPASDNLSIPQTNGQHLFRTWRASCHIIGKDATGPDLLRFEERGRWKDRHQLYEWLRDPGRFIKKDAYTRELHQEYGGSAMPAFPNLTDEEIDALAAYLN